jgi:hypothetical protein
VRLPIVLLAGLALTAIGVGLSMSRSPRTVLADNSIVGEYLIGSGAGDTVCQAGEVLPADTSALHLSLGAILGPKVTVLASAEGQPVTTGSAGSGWLGQGVTVPVKRVARTVSDARICIELGPAVEQVSILGNRTAPADAATIGARGLIGRLRIVYLRPGRRSWWSLITPVERRLGLGHAISGIWVALLILVLGGALVGLTGGLLLTELK